MRSDSPQGGPKTGPALRAVRPRPLRGLRQQMVTLLRPAADEARLVEDAPGLTLRQVFAQFWPLLRPLRGWLLLGLGIMAIASGVEVLEILLFQRLVDDVLVPADFAPLLWIALAYLGLNTLSSLVAGADDILSTWVSQRFLVSLRTDVFRHVMRLPQHVHGQSRLGDVLARLTSDINAVERFMVSNVADVLAAVVRLVIFMVALLWLQWELAVASLVITPLFWWVSSRFARFVHQVSRERARRGGSLGAVAEEAIASSALVQAYNRENDAVSSFHRQNRGIAAAELASSRVRSAFTPLIDLTELAGLLCVVTLGTWALATDRLTLGGLFAFLTLMAQSYRPIRELTDLLPELFAATASIERVAELLHEPTVVDHPGAYPLADPKGAVCLHDVWVRYPGAGGYALRNINLAASPGEVVAIVGPSGAGKSTIARLLTRQVEPATGVVRLDGHDVCDLTLRSTRDAVSVVQQETVVLDTSVRDNIAFARPDCTDQEVVQAARAADADDFIRDLPHGYRTRVGQRGSSLSGGQRQRLSLARALLRASPVLVLDEPTTGLDPDTARRVLAPLRAEAADRTVLLITHDPVALEFADRVILLDDGAIVDRPKQPRSPAHSTPKEPAGATGGPR